MYAYYRDSDVRDPSTLLPLSLSLVSLTDGLLDDDLETCGGDDGANAATAPTSTIDRAVANFIIYILYIEY